MGTDLPTCRWVHVGPGINGCCPCWPTGYSQCSVGDLMSARDRHRGRRGVNIQWPHARLFSRGIKCRRPGLLSAFYSCSLQCVFLTPVADRNSYYQWTCWANSLALTPSPKSSFWDWGSGVSSPSRSGHRLAVRWVFMHFRPFRIFFQLIGGFLQLWSLQYMNPSMLWLLQPIL